MTHALVNPSSLPIELRPYLNELVQRTRDVCGTQLVSVFAVGSLALGDYRHGRSDIDVTVIVDPSVPGLRELADTLEHSALPCPATGLELVVYGSDFAARPSNAAGYLLDLNTGPLLPNRASFDSTRSPAFWYVIDRAIAHRAGHLLYGRPVRQVLAEPARRDLLEAIRISVREHSDGAGHLADNRVLNGCRSVAFCRTGTWMAKHRAGQLIASSSDTFKPLIEAALRSFERPRSAAVPLPASEVQAFLAWVRDCVDATT